MSNAGSPRIKSPEERREDLLRSAQSLFLDRGVDQVAVEDITRGAGMSKGSFYLHFHTKGDVIVALRARFVEGLLRCLEERVGRRPIDDWPGRLADWVRTFSLYYIEATQLHALIFDAAPPPSRSGMTHNPLIDSLAHLLDAGARAGAWRLADAGFTAVFLFNALHGVAARDPTDERISCLDDELRLREERLLHIQVHVDRVVFGSSALTENLHPDQGS